MEHPAGRINNGTQAVHVLSTPDPTKGPPVILLEARLISLSHLATLANSPVSKHPYPRQSQGLRQTPQLPAVSSYQHALLATVAPSAFPWHHPLQEGSATQQ